MAIIRLQGNAEKEKQIYYEVDTSSQPIGEGGIGRVYKGIAVDMRHGSMYRCLRSRGSATSSMITTDVAGQAPGQF